MNKQIAIKSISMMLLPVLVAGFSCNPKITSKPNIVFIYVDDMGWKDTGFMGSRYYETPHIDYLASRGMVFTHGYAAASNCAPSRASLMTGKWTPRHGIFTVGTAERGESRFRKLIPVENQVTLPADIPVLPLILKDAGYMTIHAGKWHLSDNPLEYGFEVNIGGGHNGMPNSYYPPYGNVEIGGASDQYLTDLIMERTMACIDSVREPFFLNYAPYAVHVPIHPVHELLDKYRNKAAVDGQGNAEYATMVENLDRNIGLLIESLKRKELVDNTVIFFSSDNGGLNGITRQLPLRAGKGSYYEGGIRVPFVLVRKGQIKPGSVSEVPVTQIDIFPTVLEAAGIGIDGYDCDGNSLWPVLTLGNHDLSRSHDMNTRALFWHFPIYLEAYETGQDETRDSRFRTRPGSVIRYGDWKLHFYYEDNGLALYNLRQDPGERHNLAEAEPLKTEELYQLLVDWRQRTGAPEPVEENPEFEPETLSD